MTAITIGRGPSTPRPQAEAMRARPTAILALVFFLAGSIHLAWHGVDLATLQAAFPLYAMGGFTILIFGTSRLLIAGMAGRDIAGGRRSAMLSVLPAASGAALLYVASGASAVAPVAASLWSLGAIIHVATILTTVRRPPVRPPIPDPTGSSNRWPIRALEAGSLLYAFASAIALPFAYAGRVTWASAAHLLLVGSVVTTIMATALHILPRFTRRAPHAGLAGILAPIALAGPALMTLGLDRQRALLPAGAVVEGAAFVLFGALVLLVVARGHTFRPPHIAYMAAPLAIGVGGLLGFAFATTGEHAAQLATHGVLNVFGFAGLFVMGASTDLYGPALAPGAKPAKTHAWIAIGLSTVGLALAGIASYLDASLPTRAGMALYSCGVGWQLAGLISANRRAGRVIARLARQSR